MEPLTRKQFLALLARATAAVAVIPVLAACGDDEGDDEGNGGGGGCGTTIGSNHGHTLRVTATDVSAGAEKTYDITGDSDHPHTVTLTAAHFATLAGGASVSVTSSRDDGHTHEVTVSCAD